MLARAFQDDPAFGYIFPDPATRARQLPRLFRLLYDSDGAAGMRLVSEGGEAATLWRGPGRAAMGWGEIVRHLLPFAGALGTAIPRALQVSGAVEAHMPQGDFWYLHIAGCDPAAQGRGLVAVRWWPGWSGRRGERPAIWRPRPNGIWASTRAWGLR